MKTPLWYEEAAEVSAGRERQTLDLPMPSLKERDRRWALLREKMSFRGLDCLVVVGAGAASGLANVRYITGLAPFSGALAVFPFVGEPVAFYGNSQEHTPFGFWSQLPDRWLEDVRPSKGPRSIVDTIIERGLGRGRIGVVAHRLMSAPLSNISAAYLESLQRGMPDAIISDETAIVDELRVVKSDEELRLLRRAGEIARLRIDRLIDTAKPGVTEAEVWAAMEHEAIIRGGEPEPFNLFSAGPVSATGQDGDVQALLHPSYPPYGASMRSLEAGDMIICDFHTTYGGYITNTEFSVFLGQAPAGLRRIHETAGEVVRMAAQLFVPGRPIREVYTSLHDRVEAAGLDFVVLGFHGHGLSGLEFPAALYREQDLGGISRNGIGRLRLRENMVLGLNVAIHDPAWRRDVGIVLGDTVVVKPGGAEYLCKTPLDIFELEP